MFTRGALLYIGQRLVLIVFTAVAVSSIVFLGVHRLPGDALLNERRPDPAAEAALLHYYHLDLPLPEQYVRYVTGLLHGDLGESYVNRGVQITPLLLREARVSAEVGAAALVFTIGLGVLLGVIAAVRQNTWVDYLATTLRSSATACPTSSSPRCCSCSLASRSTTGPAAPSFTTPGGRAAMEPWTRSLFQASRWGSLTPASSPG